MGNIKKIIGKKPPPEKRIADLLVGETGYTVPWAVRGENLDDKFPVGKKGGTASLWVKCIAPGEYAIQFED